MNRQKRNTSKFLKINKIYKLFTEHSRKKAKIAIIMHDKGDITIETYRH